ncbi:class I SAM-dependent methyltransferase [Bdellovibrio sp. NC01]|uniref:class I SAM-dependent methyltransferase n=1 Tax=Bdellovibrio sp. NC01 TaxID=2220073 RepID=UPI00143DE29C|nr:class I SAM-dependent methyltransferase [Bdellovibrio sp. NC01]
MAYTQQHHLVALFKKIGITSERNLENKKILDVGAGSGVFSLLMYKLGATPQNFYACELNPVRFEKLRVLSPSSNNYLGDYCSLQNSNKFDLIFLNAVLTSVVNFEVRAKIIKKCLDELEVDGSLFIFDYYKKGSPLKSDHYRALDISEVMQHTTQGDFCIKKKLRIYLNLRLGKLLSLVHLDFLIPLLTTFRILNTNVGYLVITKKSSGLKHNE